MENLILAVTEHGSFGSLAVVLVYSYLLISLYSRSI